MVTRMSLVIVWIAAFSGVALAGPDLEGATLPAYWIAEALVNGVDPTMLGFNVSEAMWYYDGAPTCIGWGEFDDTCDYDKLVCSGYNGRSYGYGAFQMLEINNMLAMNRTEHQLCPNCEAAPAGEVFVCNDGLKFSVPSGTIQNDFGLPGHMSLTGRGIWMTCDCDEVHRGFTLVPGTYWYDTAAAASLDPTKVSFLNGVWYYDNKYSCVAKGAVAAPCDAVSLLCAGASDTHGFGHEQMAELHAASLLPTGEHAFCPLP